MMRIMLIDPPFQRFIGFYRFYFPLGLTYLAAVLKKAGHEVLIYDAEHDADCVSPSMIDTAHNHHCYMDALRNSLHPVWLEFIQILDEFKPQLVGISALSVKLASAFKMAALVKKYDKSIITVAGGNHMTVRPRDALRKQFDYVVCGEGEQGIVNLVQGLQNGGCPPKVIRSNIKEELDTLPLPALDCLENLSSYRPLDLGLMISARGYPFACTFCSLSTIWGKRVRYHSVDRVIQEMIIRMEKHQTKYFSFRNGTFTLNRGRIIEFCQQLLARNLEVKWECLTRIDKVDEELLQMMQRAGCDTIRLGIESGSERILKYMHKEISLAQIRKAAEILHQSSIFWSAYFMLGVPIETEETIKETISLIEEINPPFVTLARFTPLPGTPMYQEVVQSHLLDEEETSWTWAANQSLNQVFVKNMDQERFLILMEEAAQLVKEHNAANSVGRSDLRLKVG